MVKANGISVPGNNDGFRDITAELGYEVSILELRAGYRQVSLTYDEGNDLEVDTSFSGPFAGLSVAF